MKLSFVPLLLGGKMLSPETRNALNEDRRQDAAALLMREYEEKAEQSKRRICDP